MKSLRFIIGAGLAAVAALHAAAALAQSAQPVRLIVPFSIGGPTDVGARILAPYLTDRMKRAVIVDNKPGAGGAIGTELAARAAPDGATILLGTSTTMGSSPALVPSLPYDVVKSFTPVGAIYTGDNVLVVHASLPVRDVREFIAYAKVNPGKVAYGTSGVGSTYHLGTELFAARTGAALTHVPYKGIAPAVQDLLAGHIQMMMDAVASALPNIRSGRVRALGVARLTRHDDLPEVPTLAEQGVTGCEFSQWIAFFLPAGAPRPMVDKLNADLNQVLGLPEVKTQFAKLGVQPAPGTPEDLAAIVAADIAKWTKVVRDANIKPE